MFSHFFSPSCLKPGLVKKKKIIIINNKTARNNKKGQKKLKEWVQVPFFLSGSDTESMG